MCVFVCVCLCLCVCVCVCVCVMHAVILANSSANLALSTEGSHPKSPYSIKCDKQSLNAMKQRGASSCVTSCR